MGEGTNYYYNWVTGESSYEKPEGWYPPAEEVWIKQTDAKGNVYYFNQDTLESAWFPPCMICMPWKRRRCVSRAKTRGLMACSIVPSASRRLTTKTKCRSTTGAARTRTRRS